MQREHWALPAKKAAGFLPQNLARTKVTLGRMTAGASQLALGQKSGEYSASCSMSILVLAFPLKWTPATAANGHQFVYLLLTVMYVGCVKYRANVQ